MYTAKDFTDNLHLNGEFGEVVSVFSSMVVIKGLPSVTVGEIVLFETLAFGYVIALDQEKVEVVLLSKNNVDLGVKAVRTKKMFTINFNKELLGKIVDPLCKIICPLDYKFKDKTISYPVNKDVLGIHYRTKITEPLITGVGVVDLMIPLGKGQRQLVLGDRKTGKTNFVLQTLLSQAKEGVICIYCCIAKEASEVQTLYNFFIEHNIQDKCIIVSTSPTDSLGLVHMTPFSAMTIAEYFRDLGIDTLLVLDDLSSHAQYYREMSLIAKKFPGRNSYPADIFYTHSRLLERAGNFVLNNKSVSISCLPVATTVEGEISGYVQTNLMSITDGHLFFDNEMFSQGLRPAVNYFLSVTRVGRQTQSPVRWGINRELNSFLTLLDKTKSFMHFGSELNSGIKSTLAMGDRLIDFFNQSTHVVYPLNVQIVAFCLIWLGIWNDKDTKFIKTNINKFYRVYQEDSAFKKRIDDLIENAADFNALLGLLAQRKDILFEGVLING